jgi:ribosomal protein S12 methylthiotransferase accessory factor
MDMESVPDFANNMRLLYGNTAYTQAQALLAGELRFWGITAPGLALQDCKTHQALLAAYRKVHPELALKQD